jgi:uncharacterized membrane protein
MRIPFSSLASSSVISGGIASLATKIASLASSSSSNTSSMGLFIPAASKASSNGLLSAVFRDPNLNSFALSSAFVSFSQDSFVLNSALSSASWSLILPASVILSLWNQKSFNLRQDVKKILEDASSMLVSFGFGTIGSLLGSIIGIFATQACFPNQILIQSDGWKVLAACLTSSYIGGTVNYFETASAILSNGFFSDEIRNLLYVVSGIDIVTMIAFFIGLQFIRQKQIIEKQSRKPKRWKVNKDYYREMLERKSMDESIKVQNNKVLSFVCNNNGSIFPVISSLLLVKTSNFIQASIPILKSVPGSNLFISIMSAILLKQKYPARLTPAKQSSDAMLTLFYTMLGLQCNFWDVIDIGSPILMLICITLSFHLAFLLGASKLFNKYQGKSISLEQQLIASNACVGGSSTAASMASEWALQNQEFESVDLDDESSPSSNVLAASVAGIVGYLIGTPLGLMLYKVLL